MTVPGRRLQLARWSAFGLLLVIGVTLASEQVWLHPLIQSYVRRHSGRDIEFSDVNVGLDQHLKPKLILRGLTVQNASWASSKEPLIRAGEFGATFSWEGLWREPKIITRMVLVDAQVDLETRADGLRNWRLGNPNDRGPGRVRVRSLDAGQSHIRVVHEGLDLELSLESQALATGSAEAPLARSLVLQGRRHGVAFGGQAQVPAVITLYDTGEWFNLKGDISTAHAHVKWQGRAHDLMQLAGLDGDAEVSGHRIGELAAAFGRDGVTLPALPARADAHLIKDAEHWTVRDMTGRLGDSDVAGSVDYRSNKAAGARPALRATLTSDKIDVAQLRPHPASASDAARPTQKFPRSLLDADVDWRVTALQGLPLPIAAARVVLSSREGSWRLAPVVVGIAGGRLEGQVVVDTASDSTMVSTDLRVNGVQIDQLGGQRIGGKLDARLALQSGGDSMEALLGAVSGDASASLVGAALPATLEAKLGLDGGRWLQAIFADGERRPVNCSALQLRFDHGIGHIRRLALETDELLVNGIGTLELARRAIDLTLTPHRKQNALLALDKSVRVEGRLGDVKLSVVATPPGERRQACVPITTP